MINLKNFVFKLVENAKININCVKTEDDIKIQYQKKFLNEGFNFTFYYASDWCSALATLVANNIGLLDTPNQKGGYNRRLELNNQIEEAR